MEVFLVFIWFLLISLSSYYFYEVNVALPPVVAAFFSILLMPFFIFKLNLRDVFYVRRIFVFILYLLFFGLLMIFQSTDYYLNRMLAFVFYVSVVLHSLHLIVNKEDILQSALKFVLMVHLVAFYVQLTFYYSGLGFVDFLFPFTGEAQRAFGGGYEIDFLGGLFIRPTGLYNEPGTYATTIILIFLLYETLVRLSNKKINSLLQWGVMISMLLSFSVYGLVFLIFYLFSFARLNTKFISLIFLFSLFLIPVVWNTYLYPRFFSGEYAESGMGFRIEAISHYFNLIDDSVFNLLFGFGFFTDLSNIFGEFVVNDVGLIFYILVVGGIFGVGVLLACVFSGGLSKNKAFPFFIILIFSKIAPTTIIFWFLMTVAIYLTYGNEGLLYGKKRIKN